MDFAEAQCASRAADPEGHAGHQESASLRGRHPRILQPHQPSWLMRMVAHRIADAVILRLIGKAQGRRHARRRRHPNGGGHAARRSASPLLANVYLHFVLDLWFEKKVRRWVWGEAYLIRFADICGKFEIQAGRGELQPISAEAVRAIQPELADDKTRLLLFGRFAAERKAAYSETGDVRLSGLHACMRNGPPWHFRSGSSPEPKSCRKFLARTKEWLAGHRHWKRRDQQRHLTMLLRGFYQDGVHHCKPRLDAIRREVQLQWIRARADAASATG